MLGHQWKAANNSRAKQALTVDCANGVGAEALKALSDCVGSQLSATLRNTGGGGLNDACGADYVQKERRFPVCLDDRQHGARWRPPLPAHASSKHV